MLPILNGDSIINSLAFLFNTKLVLFMSYYQIVQFWDTTTNTLVLSKLESPKMSPFYRIVLSPDGRQLATGCADRIIRLWDTATGKQILPALKDDPDRIKDVTAFKGNTKFITSLTFSTDSK
jgi:WD40 repeat protein